MATKMTVESPVTREDLIKRLRKINRTITTEATLLTGKQAQAWPALFKAASSVVSTNGSPAAIKALRRAVEEQRVIDAKRKEYDRLCKEQEQISNKINTLPPEEATA